MTNNNRKKWLNWSNITTVILIAFIALMIINPAVKATAIRGLMKIGFYKPDVNNSNRTLGKAIVKDTKNVVFKDEKGNLVNMADLKGKVVFINFWAAWCPPCIAEMPEINKLQQQLRTNKNIMMLMVDVDNNLQKSLKFMNKRRFDLDVYTPASPIPPAYLGNTIPCTIVFDKNGEVAFKHEGTADYSDAEFVNFMKKLGE